MIPLQTNLFPGQTWGWDGIDQREVIIQTKNASFQGDWMPVGLSWSEIFFKLFLAVWLFDCCMKATSDAIVESGGQALQKGKFVRFMGLWLLMSTCCGWMQEDFWDAKPFNVRSNPCPYHFASLMTHHRFNQINSELWITKQDPPSYHDAFWEMRGMIWAWNKNLLEFLSPHGFWVLMNPCQFGFRGGPVLGGCFVHANPTHLGMSTTLHVVACRAWCFQLDWLREKIVQMNWDLQNMMTMEVRQLAYCCVCWRVCFTLVGT